MTDAALIGAGAIAVEHYKAMAACGRTVQVFGRGEASAAAFTAATGAQAGVGPLEAQLDALDALPRQAIVAVSVSALADVTRLLLERGVERILLEKPGGVTLDDVRALAEADRSDRVRLAYNRRFFPAARTARVCIAADGGLTSLHFEFNENTPVVAGLTQHSDAVKANWFLANSTHIADMAFFMAGMAGAPKDVELDAAVVRGAFDALPPNLSAAGAGSLGDAVFSYLADWRAAGRWGIEMGTPKRRLVLKPIETLQAIERGSFGMKPVELIDAEPDGIKPGFYNMHAAFAENPDQADFLTLLDQVARLEFFSRFVAQ
ncbi:MAG: Gfo/Idh/MocA family oxidoreductase [Pseudomonadota bacterium]